MTTISQKRLMTEYKGFYRCLCFLSCFSFIIFIYYVELAKNPVKGIAAAPVNPKNIYEWEAFIRFAFLPFTILTTNLNLHQLSFFCVVGPKQHLIRKEPSEPCFPSQRNIQ